MALSNYILLTCFKSEYQIAKNSLFIFFKFENHMMQIYTRSISYASPKTNSSGRCLEFRGPNNSFMKFGYYILILHSLNSKSPS